MKRSELPISSWEEKKGEPMHRSWIIFNRSKYMSWAGELSVGIMTPTDPFPFVQVSGIQNQLLTLLCRWPMKLERTFETWSLVQVAL